MCIELYEFLVMIFASKYVPLVARGDFQQDLRTAPHAPRARTFF